MLQWNIFNFNTTLWGYSIICWWITKTSSRLSTKTDVVFPRWNNRLDPNRALIKRKFGDIFWNSTALNSYLYQEDQQNLPMSNNLPFARDPDPSCKCSARCLPGWKLQSTESLNYNQKFSNIRKPTHRLFIHLLNMASQLLQSGLNWRLPTVSSFSDR